MKGCQAILLTTCLFLFLSPALQVLGTRAVQEKVILDTILENYDRRIRSSSGNRTDDPTVVEVNMYIRNIEKLDDVNMEWKLQVTLRQKWTDSRLKFDATHRSGSIKYVTLTETELLWMPDLFFKNEKEGHFHDMVRPNTYLRIFSDGTVLYSTRLSLTLYCPMDLKLFPMDHQTCSLKLASYAFTLDDIALLWKGMSPVQVTKNLYFPHFSLYKFSTDYCNVRTNTGSYSCLLLDMQFRRKFSHYFMTIYVPFTMFVIIAYLVFWLDRKVVSARVTLATISLAVISLSAAQINSSIAPVSYTKAIDVWTGMCVTFVFVALCECVLVNFLHPASPDESPKFRNLGRLVDIVSRIAYPAAFLLFNIIYWSTYLNADHQEGECGEHLQSCVQW